jgi:hypothetical protein
MDSQDLPRPELGGSHHLTFYSILYAWPWEQHPNVILSRDFGNLGVSKFPKLRLPQLWGPITLRAYLQLRWILKQSCSPHQNLSKGIWHATCTQGNWSDLWLLVVRSQVTNLTPDLSFGHNLCFKCPNGSCEPILNIYVPKDFQGYRELLNPMGVNPYNCSLKIQESTRTLIPKVGPHLGVRVHYLTIFYTPRAWNVTPELPFWPAPL